MKYRYESHGKIFEITIERAAGQYRATLGEAGAEQPPQPIEFEILDDQPGASGSRWDDRAGIGSGQIRRGGLLGAGHQEKCDEDRGRKVPVHTGLIA